MLSSVFARVQVRCISTSSILCGTGRMMQKILKAPRKQKKFITEEKPLLSSTNTLGSITGDGKKSVNSKRISVLNKLFMKHITDLMSTGTYSHAFTGHGIEINRVKASPDFKHVKVYWLARSDKLVENIETILKSHASALRQELTGLHVMGIVPKIVFVKDDQYTLLKLLDDKLAQADYGADHEPVDTASRLKKELELQTTLETSVRQQIELLEDINVKHFEVTQLKREKLDIDVEAMPQNVLGVDHADIMQRVKRNLLKSQGAHRKSEANTVKIGLLPNEVNRDPVSFPSMRVQREAFREFLRKRVAYKQKAQREDRTLRPEVDYLEDEWLKKREDDMKRFDFPEFLADEKDYIEDVDDTEVKY